MNTQYNFQINPDKERKEWEEIQAHQRHIADRISAIHFAERLARVFDAEIRLTQGADPFKLSGTYIRADK